MNEEGGREGERKGRRGGSRRDVLGVLLLHDVVGASLRGKGDEAYAYASAFHEFLD